MPNERYTKQSQYQQPSALSTSPERSRYPWRQKLNFADPRVWSRIAGTPEYDVAFPKSSGAWQCWYQLWMWTGKLPWSNCCGLRPSCHIWIVHCKQRMLMMEQGRKFINLQDCLWTHNDELKRSIFAVKERTSILDTKSNLVILPWFVFPVCKPRPKQKR